MVGGDPVINEALTVADAECSGNFLSIMVSSDPVVKEAFTVGAAREQV